MTATVEPTATQTALIAAAIRAMQTRHVELTGLELPADVAQQMLIATNPYMQNFYIDVETTAIADSARKAVEEVGGLGPAWTAGWLEGWDGAIAALRRRAAARGVGR